MALTDKKFSSIHGLTGNNKNSIKAKFDDGYHEVAITEVEENPVLAALVYQIGQLEEELDYLRTEISSNKDNKITIGTNTTLSFGDLTEIKTGKGTSYTITLTATRNFGGKTGSQTKSITLTLT